MVRLLGPRRCWRDSGNGGSQWGRRPHHDPNASEQDHMAASWGRWGVLAARTPPTIHSQSHPGRAFINYTQKTHSRYCPQYPQHPLKYPQYPHYDVGPQPSPCPKVLDTHLPKLEALKGLQVQRVVCGGCLDFKVVTSVPAANWGEWEAAGCSGPFRPSYPPHPVLPLAQSAQHPTNPQYPPSPPSTPQHPPVLPVPQVPPVPQGSSWLQFHIPNTACGNPQPEE